MAKVAKRPPDKHAALLRARENDLDSKVRLDSVEASPVRIPMPPEEHDVPDVDADDGLWVYLTVPKGKLPRDMIKEEISENFVDVSEAKFKEIACLYELGCFKRWPRHGSNNIIDVGWVIIWKMIEGNLGIQCRLTVRWFKDTCQDLGTYVGTTSRSGQRLANAVAVESHDSFYLVLTLVRRLQEV